MRLTIFNYEFIRFAFGDAVKVLTVGCVSTLAKCANYRRHCYPLPTCPLLVSNERELSLAEDDGRACELISVVLKIICRS